MRPQLATWPRASALAAAAVLLAGCAQEPADLFVATRGGTIAGAHLVLRVTDDGHVSCNGGSTREISSALLIDAREVQRDLADAAEKDVSLAPRPGSTLHYAFRLEDGTVRFADNSLRQKPVMFKAALLVRELAKGPCHLAR